MTINIGPATAELVDFRRPPGPGAQGGVSWLSAARYAVDYLIRGERAADRVIAEFGDVFTARIPGVLSAVVVSDPVLIKQIFTAPPDILLGGKGVSPSAVIYGPGSMFVQEEPEHVRRRKLLVPGFNGKVLAGYQRVMADVAQNALDSWPVGSPFRMLDKTRELTLEVIMRVVFGVTDPAERARLVAPLEKLLRYGASEQVVLRYLARNRGAVRHWRRLNGATSQVHAALQELVDRRRRDPALAQRQDILSLLLAATSADGERLADAELRDDLVTLLLAGHETTATTLAWAFDLLLRHPEALARVRAEAETGGAAPYTDAVVNETLRIRPVVLGTARVTAHPFQLGEWTLPAGTWIIAHIRGVNQRTASYPDPLEFRPERFLDNRPDTFAWIPFGGGVKRCLGAAFAQTELRTVLHVLLRRGDFRLARATPDTMRRKGPLLLPRHGVPTVLTDRGLAAVRR